MAKRVSFRQGPPPLPGRKKRRRMVLAVGVLVAGTTIHSLSKYGSSGLAAVFSFQSHRAGNALGSSPTFDLGHGTGYPQTGWFPGLRGEQVLDARGRRVLRFIQPGGGLVSYEPDGITLKRRAEGPVQEIRLYFATEGLNETHALASQCVRDWGMEGGVSLDRWHARERKLGPGQILMEWDSDRDPRAKESGRGCRVQTVFDEESETWALFLTIRPGDLPVAGR